MPLFKLHNNILESIKEKPFKLEKEIQILTEQNMKIIFGLEFISSEFPLNNFRIDSLAFDKESNSFIIIEYKRDKSFSVIDQGYAYLSLMLNNKADFILEYNEKTNKTLKRDDVDWSQSRVMFISPSFTTYQKEAINFKDLPIELWEITQFDNNNVAYNQIKTSNTKESIKTISKTDNFTSQVNKEVKVYTEDESLQIASDEIKELYEKYKVSILNLDDNIEIKPKKFYIAFVASSNIVDIHIQKNALKIWINLKKGLLDDSKNITKDVSNIGHWGNGDYELQIKSDDNFEYILSLIRQSLEKSK
jgi:predicted transport protein